MLCYIISYDLRKPGRNYDSLYGAIRAYGAFAHIHESVWAVVTNKSAVQIRDDLSQHLDANDRIFVVRSGVESAWRGTICTGDWLKQWL